MVHLRQDRSMIVLGSLYLFFICLLSSSDTEYLWKFVSLCVIFGFLWTWCNKRKKKG